MPAEAKLLRTPRYRPNYPRKLLRRLVQATAWIEPYLPSLTCRGAPTRWRGNST